MCAIKDYVSHEHEQRFYKNSGGCMIFLVKNVNLISFISLFIITPKKIKFR